MSVNERVKQVRQALNLSQVKFAQALSMSNSYVAGIELGHNSVNDRIIKLICFTFHVRESWLRTGEGDMFQDAFNLLAEQALTTFQELKPDYQEYILQQIDQLLAIQGKEKQELTV